MEANDGCNRYAIGYDEIDDGKGKILRLAVQAQRLARTAENDEQ
jgi:hypothetical protein